MTVSSLDVLKGFHNASRALGTKSVNSDGYFEIEGHESLSLLIKQFPWPTIGPSGEIEMTGPLGGLGYRPAQLKTGQQGPVTFYETVQGHVMTFMEQILTTGAEFNATVYEGTPDKYVRAYKLVDCFFVPDQPDRDWENRTQLTLINGTLFFHFFGGKLAGNSTTV